MATRFLQAASVIAMLSTPLAVAADPALNAALYDIDRAESQAASLTARNTAKKNRILMMIDNAKAQLERSGAKDTAEWAEASARLTALQARLTTASQPAATAPAASASVTPTPAPASKPTAGPSPADAAIASLDRRANSAWSQMQQMTATHWMRPEMVSRWDTEIAGLEALAANVAHVTSPEAKVAQEKVAFLRTFLTNAQAVAAEQRVTAEAEYAAYREIEEWTRKTRVPAAPDKPTQANVMAWLEAMDQFDTLVAKQRARAEALTATHPNLAPSMLDTLRLQLADGMDQSLAHQQQKLRQALQDQVTRVNHVIAQIAQADPQNEHDRLNRLTGQKSDWARRDLEQAARAVELIAMMETRRGMAVTDLSADATRIAGAITTLEAKQAATIAFVRFPDARVTDDQRLAEAHQALDKAGIDTAAILRAAITSEITSHNLREGRADVGAVSIEVTISTYEWDEFAVTTAEQTPQGTRLYYNLFKFYHQGGSDVPVGRLVLAERRPSTPILPEHVNS